MNKGLCFCNVNLLDPLSLVIVVLVEGFAETPSPWWDIDVSVGLVENISLENVMLMVLPLFIECVWKKGDLNTYSVLHNFIHPLIFPEIMIIIKIESHPCYLEFVTGGVELLKAVLHGYAGGLIFMK